MSFPAEAAITGPAPEYRTRRRRRKEARPSELTAAALALFVEKGFAGTRLEDIEDKFIRKLPSYKFFAGLE